MKNKQLKYFLAVSFFVLIAYILYDSFSQPNTNDLKGNFKEAALYRNENNTGPITRIYAVTVDGRPWAEMQQYGDMMPYTKYGTTTVFFFSSNQPVPQKLTPGKVNFENKFNIHCLGKYLKDANGQVSFKQFPFKP